VKVKIGSTTLECVEGDITREESDAVVNAANARLAGGGGVDGAIHRAGGPDIARECDRIREEQGGCPTGHAVMTRAGLLKAKVVIHAVGPEYKDGGTQDATMLASAYEESLKLAENAGLRSISFPSISTGAYRYPVDKAARIALKTLLEYIKNGTKLELIRIVLFDRPTFDAYARTLAALLPTRRY
jgi:O-acetyl-ADP-ribose deacetylase (regulator of RNase III)